MGLLRVNASDGEPSQGGGVAGGEHSMHEDTHAAEVAAAIEQFIADGA